MISKLSPYIFYVSHKGRHVQKRKVYSHRFTMNIILDHHRSGMAYFDF